jgi:hypothetical protein
MIQNNPRLKSALKRRPLEDTYLHDCKMVDNLISIRLVKMSILKNFLRNFITKSKWHDDAHFDVCFADEKKFSFFVR